MTHVYLLKNEIGHCKIGVTRHNPRHRVSGLQVGSSIKIDVIAFKSFENSHARQLESELHRKYREFRLCGEWFALSQDQVKEVVSVLTVKERTNIQARKRREVEITTETFKQEYLRQIEASAYLCFISDNEKIDANGAMHVLKYFVDVGVLRRAPIAGSKRNPIYIYRRSDIDAIKESEEWRDVFREFYT